MSTTFPASNEPLSAQNDHSTEQMIDSDTFTMVFLDFDDTLFPSRMYQLFANHLCIDLFDLFSNSSLLKLQHTIIECIDSIREQYEAQHIVFSVVSNASQSWLDSMFKGSGSSVHINTPRLAVLNEYFEANDICIVSASAKAYAFVQNQFGDKAQKVFNSTLHSANDKKKRTKFMWKYTAFGSVISTFCRKTRKRCDRIISVGDGDDEEKAAQRYTEIHRIHSIHIPFIRTPTIDQLIHQWMYLKCHFHGKLKGIGIQIDVFRTHDLYKECILNYDNNPYCTGKMYQLPAIQHYFEYWMEHVVSRLNAMEKKIAIEKVCTCIHRRLYSLKPRSVLSRNFKLILAKVICRNSEFNEYFNIYYETIQKHSKRLQKTKMNARRVQQYISK